MADWTNRLKKNRVLRKSFALLNQLPRALKRVLTSSEDHRLTPPVIGNAFPRSGTHLLLQAIEAIPGVTNYGTYIASKPAITFQERSSRAHLRMMQHIVPAEVIPANLFYAPSYHAELKTKNCVIFFIYRDLRDVVVSEAHFLTYSYRVHRLHRYYARSLTNMEERLSTEILGVTDQKAPYSFPNIAERFARYRGWLDCPDVLSVRFEDLVSDKQSVVLRKMAAFYAERCAAAVDVDNLVQSMVLSINPSTSYTFRKGKAGSWKEEFTEEHKAHMKSVAGKLLIELGYEEDLNW
jgi:hypothetical protein